MANSYVSSAAYTAVPAWNAVTAYLSSANGGRGSYVRQLAAPAVNAERVFRCTTSGTSGAAEPTWVTTKNGVTAADGTAAWTECTGQELDQTAGVWKAPHARKVAALAAGWFAAGDTLYTGLDHAETQGAALLCYYPGTMAAPCRDLCVRIVSGSIPPVLADIQTAPTASMSVTSTFTMEIGGCCHIRGMIFNVGSGASAGPAIKIAAGPINSDLTLENCQVNLVATGSSNAINIGDATAAVGQRVRLRNFAYKTSNATQLVQILQGCADIVWKNDIGVAAIDAASVVPTALFGNFASGSGICELDSLDLSLLSTKTIFSTPVRGVLCIVRDCKLPASITVQATPTSTGAKTYVTGSASDGSPYVMEKHDARGDQTTEKTIVRTGGVTVDTVAVSMKIVGTANASLVSPFEAEPIVVPRNTVVGTPVTMTVYCIWDGGALPTNAQVWMEVRYLGSATSPQRSSLSGKALPLAVAVNQAADASVWGGSTTAFKLVLTVTPLLAGSMYAIVKSAVTTAIYVDPVVVLS